MFGAFAGFANLMKNSHLIQERAQELKVRLGQLREEAHSSDRQVTVVVSGEMKVISVSISDELAGDATRLAQVIQDVTNEALVKAREAAAREFAEFAKGLGVPELPQMMSRFGINMN